MRFTEQELDWQKHEMLELSDKNRNLVQIVAQSILESRFEDKDVQISKSRSLLSLLGRQRKKLLSLNLSESISGELGSSMTVP